MPLAGARGWSYSNWIDFSGRNQQEPNKHRELRPPFGGRPQEHSPFVSYLSLFAASGECNEPRRVQPAERGGGELRGSTSRKSTANSSAQRDTKTVTGFRARRTATAPSSPQFSAPWPPHCGSAFAPPRFYAHSLSARLGKSCQNTQASFDDFPFKAWRAVELCPV